MKSPELSLKVFATYLILIPGLGLVLFPIDIFTVIGAPVPPAESIWSIRMIGYLAFALGVYYMYMASFNLVRMFPITVVIRLGAAIFMTILWLSGETDISILGFAIMDFTGATWTFIAIRARKNPSS